MSTLFRKLTRMWLPPHWLLRINHLTHIDERALDQEERLRGIAEILLRRSFPNVTAEKPSTAEPRLHEFSIYSQNGEDGILLHLFSTIGPTDCRFVEIGSGNGRECNTANLSLNFGWSGLLIDQDPLKVESARRFYRQLLRTKSNGVQVFQETVTADNVNGLISKAGFRGAMDLLSIDLDGNDYWIWKSISVVRPRVLVIEYNASLGPERSITVPYNPRFNCFHAHPSGFYHGASLAALENLGRSQDYLLVGCDSRGVNAFFVEENAAQGRVPMQTADEAYRPHFERCRKLPSEAQWALVRDMEWVTI